jgi:hypothetical protein
MLSEDFHLFSALIPPNVWLIVSRMIRRSVWLMLSIAFITLVPSTVSYAAAELDDEQPTMLRSMSNKSVVSAGAWPVWPTPPATEIAGGPGANASDPLVTVGDDGRTTLVWKQRGSNDSVHVATRAAGSASFGLTEQIQISATGKYITSLDMATGPDGTTTIVWTRQDGSSSKYVVHATTRSPGSSSFGPVEDLSDPSTNSWTPKVVVDAAGQSTVAWRTSASGGELVTATRAPGASNFATSSVYATYTGSPAIQLVADDSGATTLLWTVDTGSMSWTGLAVADRPPGAVNFGSATTVVTNYASLPSFATSPAGDLTLAYEETDSVSPYSETLKVRTRPAGSSTFGAPEQIPGAVPVGTVEVAVGRDGTTAVLWFEDLSSKYVSYAAVRGAGEGTWTTESLSNPDPVKQGQIAVGPDGAVTAVWSHQGAPDVIEVQTRQPGNSSFDSSVDVSATNSGNDPQIAIGPDGAATVTWYTDPGRVEYVTSSATSYDLSVTSTGPGSGSIDSTPGGISCGATCTFGFDLSSTVVLSATPAAGSTFSGWSGSGCAGTGNCSVAVNGLQSVSAQFDTVPAVAPIPGPGDSAPSTPAAVVSELPVVAPVTPVVAPVTPVVFDDVAGVDTATIQALTPAQVATIAVDQFKNLKPKVFGALTAEQLEQLPIELIRAIRPARAAALNPDAISALSAAQLNVMRVESMRSLTPAQVAAIPSLVVESLSPFFMSQLKPRIIAALSPDALALLTPAQVAAIRPAALKRLSVAALRQITPQALAATSVRQLKKLSKKQVTRLTDAQKASLSPEQLEALGIG